MLVAIVVSTIVFGATYAIYGNFQKTFVKQINYNNLKQEARFALHALQYDSRMSGFKHDKTTNGEVQIPVTVLKDDGNGGLTDVTSDTEYGETVFFCFDTTDGFDEDNKEIIQRKLIQYQLQIPYSTSTEKTVLKKKIWNTTNCDEDDTINTTVEVDWMPVAQFFNEFKIRLRSKHIDFEIILETVDKDIRETYTASSFMRNLNFGGKIFYVSNEENLIENRVDVMPFTGSLKVQCSDNIILDIQTASFQTEDDLIILHQGETVGDQEGATHKAIRFESEKPAEITGLPSVGHTEMRLKLSALANNALPPGLSIVSGFTDINNDNVVDVGEEWDGSVTLEGTLENDDSNYVFNSSGFQDFTINLKAELETNCNDQGFKEQNIAFKKYKVRVNKYSAPQFSDVNLHTWDPKGLMQGFYNYESHRENYREQFWMGGPFYELSADGRSFYLQQWLTSPAFLVSKEEYDSFAFKGIFCTGNHPVCGPSMSDDLYDGMLGFAAGYKRPNIVQKKKADGEIRACEGVDYKGLKNKYILPGGMFNESGLKKSLSQLEQQEWATLNETEKDNFFGKPADNFFDMYLWSWWGSAWSDKKEPDNDFRNGYNNSAIQVHHYKNFQWFHQKSCGYGDWARYNHKNLYPYLGYWPTKYASNVPYTLGYDKLYEKFDNVRPLNTGFRNCGWGTWSSKKNSFSQISYNPGAKHITGIDCSDGRNAGVKNIVSITYHPNLFKASVDNKPYNTAANSQRFTAFDLRFDDKGVLKKHTSDNFPFNDETASPSNIDLPIATAAVDGLKAENFKRFQKGAVAVGSYTNPNNQYKNFQIARLPRFIPSTTATNKPMPKAQNLNFYLSKKYDTVSKIYGLLSKSYDPAGNDIELLVYSTPTDDDTEDEAVNCATVGNIGIKAIAETDSFKTQTVDGKSRSMNCRLSGTWRAKTEQEADKQILPVINYMYDINQKEEYEGARASIETEAGGTVHVFADGSFKYHTLPTTFTNDAPGKDSFYYAVQTSDTGNKRISDIKRVYIGYNIGNNDPTGVSFKDEDGTSITDLSFPEDAKKDYIISEIFASSTDDLDQYDFVRINLGDVPDGDSDKDVDHISRFRIDQKDKKFFLVLNTDNLTDNLTEDTNISWGSLPENKKYFSARIIATDLKGKQYEETIKVYVDRVDCTETAMTGITVYKTKAAMTISGYLQGKQGTSVFRRQTVPFTSNSDDEAVINFDFEEREVQPSVKIYEKIITVNGVDQTIGMIANRCKNSHDYVDVQQLWSNSY